MFPALLWAGRLWRSVGPGSLGRFEAEGMLVDLDAGKLEVSRTSTAGARWKLGNESKPLFGSEPLVPLLTGR